MDRNARTRTRTRGFEDFEMNSLYLDHDAQMSQLETEWRQAYEASIAARSDYQSLTAKPGANADLLDRARPLLRAGPQHADGVRTARPAARRAGARRVRRAGRQDELPRAIDEKRRPDRRVRHLG